jgi:hypothetical protein
MIFNLQQMPMKPISEMFVTSHSGKRQSQEIHLGQHLGVQAVLDGTSNVLRWHTPISVNHLISMVVD